MNQATRKVEIELFVCPGCDYVIDALAKHVDNLYFHNLNCWNMWKQRKLSTQEL